MRPSIPPDFDEAVKAAAVVFNYVLGGRPALPDMVLTPVRMVKSLMEMTAGTDEDVGKLLSSFDADGYDEMILVKGCEVRSVCAHHLLPFLGVAHVAYVPKDKIAGLSKIPRLVDALSRRLQMQERLTVQITRALDEHLAPLGSACVVEAYHCCTCARGIKSSARMVTSSLTGVFRDDPSCRAEFFSLIKG